MRPELAQDSEEAHRRMSELWQKMELVGYGGLDDWEQIIFDVCFFNTEVNNGGLHQFFWNPVGDRALETIKAFERIGASYIEALLRRACELFPRGKPAVDQKERIEQLERLSEEDERVLDELSDAYWDREEKIFSLLLAYLAKVRPRG